MSTRIGKKKHQETNVYEKALERAEYLFDNYDNVVVMFSGGKDSTAVLQICLEVKEKKNIKKPLEVIFFDEECIHPPTIEYMERVSKFPDVNLKWFCLPVKHRNACSYDEPWWYTWDKNKKDLWVRDLPEQAITEHPLWVDDADIDVESFTKMLYEGKHYAIVLGIRTQESIRRYRAIASKQGELAWLQETKRAMNVEKGKHRYIRATNGYIVYDWSSEDVWRYVLEKGYDYNKTYDIYNKTELYNSLGQQRVCPPFGEEPLRSLHLYRECFPDLWEKMLYRVDGVATAMRYANTELYGTGMGGSTKISAKPKDKDWRQFFDVILDNYDGEQKRQMKGQVNKLIKRHYNVTDDKIPDEKPHMISGANWKFFTKILLKGDLKDRQAGSMQILGNAERRKQGVSDEEAFVRYGKKQ